jgi:hypothetical protein
MTVSEVVSTIRILCHSGLQNGLEDPTLVENEKPEVLNSFELAIVVEESNAWHASRITSA